jgi:hypothetical protein
MGHFKMFKEFELLKVKVPIIFLGTADFSHPRDARCYIFNYILKIKVFILFFILNIYKFYIKL